MPADNEDIRPSKRPHTVEETPLESLTTNAPSASSGNLNPGRDLNFNLTRHEEFWFDDGSVVLVAKDTGFRVFRSLLAAQSTVFADTLSSSSLQAHAETFEGYPVVRLSDSPQEVAHLLRVLLPPPRQRMKRTTHGLFSRTSSVSFHQLSSLIRLAHKYNLPDILDQMITFLQMYFTSDFDAWNDDALCCAFEVQRQHSIAVINLARSVGVPSLLPFAFYMCISLHGAILDGFEREDKTVEYLSQEDVKRCMDGANKLVDASLAVVIQVFSFTADPSRADAFARGIGCKCPAALHAVMGEAVQDCIQTSVSALTSWVPFIQHNFSGGVQLCESCKQAAVERDYNARRRVWEALPAIFDIEVDGWPSSAGDGPSSEGGVVSDNVVSATT